MRLTSYIISALLIGAVGVPIAGAQRAKANASFDPSGNYHPVDPPGGPDKFVQFNLRMSKRGRRWLAVGEVRGAQPWHTFSTAAIDRRSLRFVTASRDRVRYEFRGEFLRTGMFADAWTGQGLIAIKGKLSKYARGKKAWEIKTPFVYYPPH